MSRHDHNGVSRRTAALTVVLATALFAAIGATRLLDTVKEPSTDQVLTPLHPHHPDSYCYGIHAPGQDGFAAHRAFDGRVRWKKPEGPIYERDYQFSTQDMFSHNIQAWEEILAEYVGQPNLSYLEVGLAEGGSALWMLENVLTSTSSRLTGIDINHWPNWRKNIEISGRKEQTTTLLGSSQRIMRMLEPSSFDIIYIDGSHSGDDVLEDAVLAWALLKPGGTMIFDDYCLDYSDLESDRSPRPLANIPKLAIDSFVFTHAGDLDIVHQYYQLAIEKREEPRCRSSRCTPLGSFAYDWEHETLLSPKREPVPLSSPESLLLRSILRTRRLGRPGFDMTAAQKASPHLHTLEEKLGLKIEELTNPNIVRAPASKPAS